MDWSAIPPAVVGAALAVGLVAIVVGLHQLANWLDRRDL